jgi:adenylate cyclase
VKNIPEPIRVYAVKLDGIADSAPEPEPQDKEVPKLPDRPSIAVLPFDNMSGDPEQDYFADGIVEDIITELSRDPDLFVIARNSSFAYKGQSPDIRQVARELGVRYVLEGSVRRAGNRIRLNAQLIEAETGHHVWAERYDRTLEDVFEVQDELTNTIQNRLVQKVRDTGIEGVLRRAPKDMNAYDHMLRGFGLLLRFNRANNEEAIREAQAALDLDPDYARAYNLLAWAHLYSVWSAWADDIEQALERGYEAAQKAVAADRNDFFCYGALGFAELCMHRNDHALAALDRAVALNPNSADVHALRGVALNYVGRPEDGLREVELAIRHNPYHPDWYLLGAGRAYYFLGRYEDAIHALERVKTALPELTTGRLMLAATYVAADRQAQAEAEVASILEDNPTVTLAYVRAMVPFQKEEDMERYLVWVCCVRRVCRNRGFRVGDRRTRCVLPARARPPAAQAAPAPGAPRTRTRRPPAPPARCGSRLSRRPRCLAAAASRCQGSAGPRCRPRRSSRPSPRRRGRAGSPRSIRRSSSRPPGRPRARPR